MMIVTRRRDFSFSKWRSTKDSRRKRGKKRKRKKRQIKDKPSIRLKEILEEVLETISDFMAYKSLWTSEERIKSTVMEKKPFDDLETYEILQALRCGSAFGLILKRNGCYSLPRDVHRLLEEGKMPDIGEWFDEWKDKPKMVSLKKKMCQCNNK